MNFALLAPLGLAALALPLLIHLARRTEAQPTDFAALRWLRASARPRKRPRLDERVLLAVRLALLALLAVWAARPVLTHSSAAARWVAVVPGVDPGRAASLVAAGARGIWLAPGFPTIDTPVPAGQVPVASLVRELDATLPADAPLTVLVPPVIAGADAERPSIARTVQWNIVPGRMPDAAAPPPERLTIAVRAAPGVAGLRYLTAGAAALSPSNSSPGALDVGTTSAQLPKARVLIWWANGEIPAEVRDWAARGGRVLVPAGASLPPGPTATIWRDGLAAPLAEAMTVGRGRIVRFTRSLEPAAMPILLDSDFPRALHALVATPPPAPARIRAADYAPDRTATSSGGREARRATPRDLQPWFAVVLAALFVLERWLATRRQRAPAP